MKIALASPPFPKSINDGLYWIEILAKDAAEQGAEIICFPETYIPGYPLEGYVIEKSTPEKLQAALDSIRKIAAEHSITIIIPMDWYRGDDLFNVAYVISNTGEVLGYQTKNQLDPSEDTTWVPGTERSVFEVNDVKFGITICHEGFRYPESVRWAAREGAHIIFHPHFTGSDHSGPTLTEWGHKDNPYYEKAMMMRALENTIYFAGINYATRYSESGSAVIAPDGKCIVANPYSQPGVVVAEIDLALATGFLAKRFKPELYS